MYFDYCLFLVNLINLNCVRDGVRPGKDAKDKMTSYIYKMQLKDILFMFLIIIQENSSYIQYCRRSLIMLNSHLSRHCIWILQRCKHISLLSNCPFLYFYQNHCPGKYKKNLLGALFLNIHTLSMHIHEPWIMFGYRWLQQCTSLIAYRLHQACLPARDSWSNLLFRSQNSPINLPFP